MATCDEFCTGFVVIPSAIFRDGRLSERARLLYGHIFSKTPALTGYYHTTLRELAQATSTTTVQTNKCLAELEEYGRIFIRQGDRHGSLGDVVCEILIGLKVGDEDA